MGRLSQVEIATALGVHPSAVKRHVEELLSRTGHTSLCDLAGALRAQATPFSPGTTRGDAHPKVSSA